MMAGPPNDLRIPEKREPLPDEKAEIERLGHAEGRLDDGKKKVVVLKNLWMWLLFNHAMVFTIVIMDGWGGLIKFDLDMWVLISLIGGAMGSSTIYFIKRSADFAYSRV